MRIKCKPNKAFIELVKGQPLVTHSGRHLSPLRIKLNIKIAKPVELCLTQQPTKEELWKS